MVKLEVLRNPGSCCLKAARPEAKSTQLRVYATTVESARLHMRTYHYAWNPPMIVIRPIIDMPIVCSVYSSCRQYMICTLHSTEIGAP